MLFRGKCEPNDNKPSDDGSSESEPMTPTLCNAIEGYVAAYEFSEKESNLYYLARWTRDDDGWKIHDEPPIRRNKGFFTPDVEGKLTLTVKVEGQKYTLKANEVPIATIEDHEIEPPDEQLGIGVRLPENGQSATIEFHLVAVDIK